MNNTKIHLIDFPYNIAIGLKNEFRLSLFKELSKKYRKKEICKIFGISHSTLNNWEKGKNLMPLDAMNKIANLKNFNYSWNSFEKNTIEYKTQHGEINSVKNPILPIKDSKELREVIIHLMADGCVEKYAAYYNYDINAKKEFIKELYHCFGDIGYKMYKDHVQFSMAIPHILRHYFKIDFLGHKCRIPRVFFEGKKDQLNAILRAMLIDEGTIDGSNVRLDSANLDFLADVRNIAVKLGYKVGKIWRSKGPIFRFNILSESNIGFYNEIKPIPIKNKEKLLCLAIATKNRKWKYFVPGTIKVQIVKHLLNKPTSTIKLSDLLGIYRNGLNKHWKWLLKEDLVKVTGKDKYSFIYAIKNRDKATMFIKNPEYFLQARKFKEYGMSQLKVLEFLNQNQSKLKNIKNLLGNSKSSTLKVLNSLIKKEYINKKDKVYTLTKKGKELIKFDKKLIRFVLYSNVKNLKDIKDIDLTYAGLV